ncbi:MAG: phosphate ABC transporter substrate-binding protein [Treponemataceae bacterium]|nr:phosphate ABC transporter substrate-binding protein [Treponemataceae bacterium]
MKKIILVISALFCMTNAVVFASGSKENKAVSTDGSTSMEKVIGILAESFEAEKGITVSYNPSGSGAGITAVKEGRCDIGLSSRSLKQAEKDSGLKETVLAYDGIALIVNEKNTVSALTLKNISDIYTGVITNWSQLGGEDAQIVVIGREAGSGTRDGFESVTGTKDKCVLRQELTSTGDVIASVASNANAIGYASLASVKGKVKIVSVEGVEPSEATIKNGTYKVQRPFVLVTDSARPLGKNAESFFNYATSPAVKPLLQKAGVVSAN